MDCLTPDDWNTWPLYPVDYKNYRGKFQMPLLVMSKELESKPEKYLDLVRRLSDTILFAGNSIFDASYVNHPELSQMARGHIKEADYWEADYVYGQKSFVSIKDNHFFEAAKNYMLGEVTSQPFKFITKNINNEYSRRRIKTMARNMAKAVLNVAAQDLTSQGIGGMGQEPYPEVDIRGSKDTVLSRLNPQESVEYVIYALLQHIHYNYDFLDISKKCFDNAFDINARFAAVTTKFGEVVPEHLFPAQVRWLSLGPIETFEDEGVLAAGYHKWRTIEDTLAEEGVNLFKAFGVSGLTDAIKKVEEGERWQYNPEISYDQFYFSSINSGSLTIENSGIQRQEYFTDNRFVANPISWGNDSLANWFYPNMNLGGVRRAGVLTHKFYFKMIHRQRMLVLIDGKNTTKEAFVKKVKHDFSRKHRIEIRKVDEDYKAARGECIIELPERRLHQATRIGHSVLVDCGLYKHAKTGGNRPGIPIVAKIVNEKSFVKLGIEMARRINLFFQRIDEIITQMGNSTAILIDEAQESDPVSFLYNARRTGIALYNSNRMRGGTDATMRHMTTLSVDSQIQDLTQLFQLAGMYKMSYENMIGVSPQVQGVYQKYSGLQQTQLNVANQSLLKQRAYFEHTKFMNELLQRTADVARSFYAEEDELSLIMDKDRQIALRIPKDMNLADIDVYLESGADLANRKQKLDEAATRILSGAGVDFFEPLLDILSTDNIQEARALWRETLPLIKQLEQTNSQRQAEALQRQADAIEQKNQIVLERENIITEREIALKRMENEQKKQDNDFQGEMKDIDEINARERMIMQSLEKDYSTQK